MTQKHSFKRPTKMSIFQVSQAHICAGATHSRFWPKSAFLRGSPKVEFLDRGQIEPNFTYPYLRRIPQPKKISSSKELFLAELWPNRFFNNHQIWPLLGLKPRVGTLIFRKIFDFDRSEREAAKPVVGVICGG